MGIRVATLTDLTYLAHSLRARDRQELEATRGDINPDQLAVEAYASPLKYVATGRQGFPVLCVGARPLHEGAVQLWGFGSDAYREGAREMTIFIKTVMIPDLTSSGVHRGQCIVHPANRASQRWLRALGFVQEAVLRGFSTSRKEMLLFAWVEDEPGRE